MNDSVNNTVYLGQDRRRNPSPHASSQSFDIKEVIKFFLRHYKLFLALSITSCLVVSLHHHLFPLYRSRASVYFENKDAQIQMINNRMQGLGYQTVQEDLSDKYLRYIHAYDFHLSVVQILKEKKLLAALKKEALTPKDFTGYIRYWKNKWKLEGDPSKDEVDLYYGDALEAWTSLSKAGPEGIYVQFTTTDRELSRTMADIIAEQAVKWISDVELSRINSAVKYLNDRIKESDDKIQKLDDEMLTYKKENKIYSVDNTDTAKGGNSLERELELLKIEYSQNERLLDKYKTRLQKQEQEAFQGEEGAPVGFKIKTDLAQKIAEKEGINQGIEARISSIQNRLNKFDARAVNIEHGIFDFKKKFELEYSLNQDLKKEMFRVEMQKISMFSKVQNIQKAQYSEVSRTISLSKKLVLTMAVALAVAAAVSFFMEMLWPTVKGRNDLDQLGFSFLGNIPDFSNTLKRRSAALFHKFNNKVGRVFRFDTDSFPITAFLKVRTKILYHLEQNKIKNPVIAFVSAGMGEGKTFTASNMAACIASSNKKTLFIDADMRAAGASRLYESLNQAGLADVLNSPESFGRTVVSNTIPNLDFLPAGRRLQNPTELLESEQFRDLLEKLRVLYDYIVIDTPPLLVASDAAIVGKYANMMVFVACFDKTQQEALIRSCENILDLGISKNKFFSVLNKVDSRYDSLVMLPYPYYGKAYKKQSAEHHI